MRSAQSSNQLILSAEEANKLRVLFVPDSVHWVTGTIAKNIARFNPWIEATIASGPVIDQVLVEQPELIGNFDLVHFTCPYSSRRWLSHFQNQLPCVTSHHHVTDWEAIKHNAEGDAIIVGAPEWAEDLRARGANMSKVFCIPYGVDATLFRPATATQRKTLRQKLHIDESELVIGFFGKNSSNDDDRKGIDVFTQALLSLRSRTPKLVVLIIGPGWQTLTQELRSSGVKCVWIPFVEDVKELSRMYQALDFYWVTARIEGGPVTLLEAMSSEVCCLATPVGIAPEIIRHGENGLIVPFADAEGFAHFTLELWDASSERIAFGRNARNTILQQMHVGITSLGVKAAYERAFENFGKRRQDQVRVDLNAIADGFPSTSDNVNGIDSVPLAGFPVRIHQRVKMLEALAWSEHLVLYHRQRAIAASMILRQWVKNPLSLLPARVLLRRFLPVSLTARLVKVKQLSQGSSRLLPVAPPTKKA